MDERNERACPCMKMNSANERNNKKKIFIHNHDYASKKQMKNPNQTDQSE